MAPVLYGDLDDKAYDTAVGRPRPSKAYNKTTASFHQEFDPMRGIILFCSSALAICAQSTTQSPVIGGPGYSFPIPLPVAPGQVITLFVQGVNTQLTAPVRATTTPWPTTLAGVKVTYTQGSAEPAPILEVRPISTCLEIGRASCRERV